MEKKKLTLSFRRCFIDTVLGICLMLIVLKFVIKCSKQYQIIGDSYRKNVRYCPFYENMFAYGIDVSNKIVTANKSAFSNDSLRVALTLPILY